MAVEARHPSFFPTNIDPNISPYNGGYGFPPLSGTTAESFVPMYNNHSAAIAGVTDSFLAKAAGKADSGLTYPNHFPISRKRLRETINPTVTTSQTQNANRCGSFTFLGEDVSLQIQQQQLEMDRLVAQHNDEVRREIEERRRRYSRRIIAEVGERVMKRLKAKDDEIEKIGKLNWALQEKVKSLTIEGQIWRDLAHTKEAAAQALRANLDQVLAAQMYKNVESQQLEVDGERSCCGSNYREEDGEECETNGGDRKCRHCGEAESSVLLLPCRHLCLCTVCGSSAHTCPVCKTPKNASLHVIMPS